MKSSAGEVDGRGLLRTNGVYSTEKRRRVLHQLKPKEGLRVWLSGRLRLTVLCSYTGCVQTNLLPECQECHSQHLVQKSKTRGMRVKMEAGQLSWWPSGLAMQGLEQVCVVYTGSLWPALMFTCCLWATGPGSPALIDQVGNLKRLSRKQASAHWG